MEASLRRSLPIITTPHAKSHLSSKSGEGEAFTDVYDLDFFDEMFVDIQGGSDRKCAMKVIGMPGKHVPPGVLGAIDDLLRAVYCMWGCTLRVLTKSLGPTDQWLDAGIRIW